MPNQPYQLIAVILTKDEVDHIGDCVASLRDWVDAVVVWDSGGKDGQGGATSGFLSSLAGSLPPMLHMMKDIGGVDMPEYFGKLVAGEVPKKEASDEEASEDEAAPVAADEAESPLVCFFVMSHGFDAEIDDSLHPVH